MHYHDYYDSIDGVPSPTEMCIGWVQPNMGREDYCGAEKPVDVKYCASCQRAEIDWHIHCASLDSEESAWL